MLKYQNYQHYKLPITINPLEYGKLIYQNENKYIIQINKTNVVIITQNEEFNEIKLFREGILLLEYKDHIINENTFIRSLNNNKFTFKDNILISVMFEKSINYIDSNPIKFNSNKRVLNNYSFIRSFSTSSNIIKLRKLKGHNI